MRHSDRIFRFGCIACLLVLGSGCGGDGGSGSSQIVIPPEATMAQDTLKTQLGRFPKLMANGESGFLFILNPDAALTPGMTLMPDPQPGAAPNSYTFDGTFDGDGDGVTETSLTGNVKYAGDPSSLDWSPATGQATTDINIPLLGHVYHAVLDFRAAATDVRVSGSGTFAQPLSGATTTLGVPSGSPLVIRAVNAQNGAVANACGYNVDGSISAQLTGPTGTYESTWLFAPNTTSVAVQQVTFTDPSGKVTNMPDSTTTLTCGDGGSINDWAAAYRQDWVCLPLEYGSAKLTLTVSGANTVTITDEDPPGSGSSSTYTATIIGSSPHALQGFFDSGPVGNRYREHFTWTLGKNGGFSQWSNYAYTEGVNNGKGGVCAGSASRLP